MPEQTKIANGNIMARLRMMYLYNQAGIKKGIVIDTDNLTEHYLGFWTIHGDEGDLILWVVSGKQKYTLFLSGYMRSIIQNLI